MTFVAFSDLVIQSVGHTLKEIKSLQENDTNIGPILMDMGY